MPLYVVREGYLVGDGDHGCQLWPQSGPDLLQMGNKSRNFQDKLSAHFGSPSQLILKSPRFVPMWCENEAKSEPPANHTNKMYILADLTKAIK